MSKLPEQIVIEREIERIAGELVAHCKREQPGESTDIFNGSAGILLFFLSLYKYNKKAFYLQTAQEIAGRLLQHTAILNPRFYTFYGGAAGMLYVCVQLHKVTGNKEYLTNALELAYRYRAAFTEQVTQCDLLSGKAGILLAVLHLYAQTKDPSLLYTIDSMVSSLVSGAHIAPAGLKWDTHKQGYDSLTGFSHGTSGIAFALMQTGYYFGAAGLKNMAAQAYSYESAYYDDATGNYMDLRVGAARMTSIQQQHQYTLLDWPLHIFTPTMSGISSWAHGAAGCALSRLFAWETTHEQEYAAQARQALACSWEYYLQQQHIDYSLCSGYGGIAAIFERAAEMLNEPVWHTRSLHIAMTAIDYYNKHHTYNSKIERYITDYGLFSGLAGVGYWLLGCLQSLEPDDILHPAVLPVHLPCNDNNIISEKYAALPVNRAIYSKYYPETIQQITALDKEATVRMFDKILTIDSFELSLRESGVAGNANLPHTYELEKQVTVLWKRHKGFLQHNQRRLMKQAFFRQCQQLTDSQWLEIHLKTDAHLALTYQQSEQKHVLYYCHETGIDHMPVTSFTAVLLQHFEKYQPVATVAAAIQQQYFSNENETSVQQAAIKQVKELVQAGFLTTQTP